MFSTDIASENLAKRNLEKRENREQAKQVLETNSGTAMMASLAAEGGPMAKRIAREIRKFESTGRVSNWLSGETIKAESKREIPSTAVDDFLIKGRPISSLFAAAPRRLPFNGDPKFKPEIPSEGGVASIQQPWDIYVINFEDGTYTLKVRAGTVSGILPENWEDEFPASENTLYYGVVTVKTDGQFINGAEIDISTSAPQSSETTENSAPSEAKFIFGIFKDGTNINVSGGRDISVGVQNVFATERIGGSFGTPAYNLWYRIQ